MQLSLEADETRQTSPHLHHVILHGNPLHSMKPVSFDWPPTWSCLAILDSVPANPSDMSEVQITCGPGLLELGCLIWLDESFGHLVKMSLPVTQTPHHLIIRRKRYPPMGPSDGLGRPPRQQKNIIYRWIRFIGGYVKRVKTISTDESVRCFVCWVHRWIWSSWEKPYPPMIVFSLFSLCPCGYESLEGNP